MHAKTRLTIALCCVAALGGAGAAEAQTATEVWRLGGLAFPESVILDGANNRLIVGNMMTFGPDGGTDGYLSTVSLDGKVIAEHWVDGLSDPKGMAIVGDRLFVADSNGLVEIGLGDGGIANVYPLPGAQLPNDVTTDGGDVYVSDLIGQAIYRLSNGSVETWLSGEALHFPNGLLVDGNALILGSMGTGMKPDFSFETKGGLQSIDIATKAITPLAGATDLAMTDGVVKVGDSIVFTDNPTGTVYAYAGGTATAIATLAPGAADLWADGNMIYVPLTQTGELVALRLD